MKVAAFLCSLSAIYSGKWYFDHGQTLISNPWEECPILGSVSEVKVKSHKHKYSCLTRPYLPASYEPFECTLLNIHDSMRFVHASFNHSTRRKIVFAGDSFIQQLALSANCTAESFKFHNFELCPIWSEFLRDDYPCEDQCVYNETFRNELMSNKFSRCLACTNGIRSKYNTSGQSWLHHVSVNQTAAIVLGSGAWYNAYLTVGDPNIYNDTLNKVGRACQFFQQHHGIPCFWIGLPPVSIQYAEYPSYSSLLSKFSIYPTYNRWAQFILQQYGVTFINIEMLLTQRKSVSPNVSVDGVHWWWVVLFLILMLLLNLFLQLCSNPGINAVPTFINRVIFHLLATKEEGLWSVYSRIKSGGVFV